MKARVSFAKSTDADRYAGDLTRLRIADGRRISIKRPWMRVGEEAAAGRHRSSAPRRRPAGVGFPGVPGLILGCGLVQRNKGGVRNPLGG
jgi:hypothetical protein